MKRIILNYSQLTNLLYIGVKGILVTCYQLRDLIIEWGGGDTSELLSVTLNSLLNRGERNTSDGYELTGTYY